MSTCSPAGAKRWLEGALRRLETGGDREVVANELRIAKRLLGACAVGLGGAARRRRRRRRRR